MRFEYQGKWYDTAKSEGEESTNRLQVTEDEELQLTVVNKYFGVEQATTLLRENTLDILFELALTEAKYTDIIEELSGFTKPGTYPDWVIKSAREQSDAMMAWELSEMVEDSENADELVQKVKDLIEKYGY